MTTEELLISIILPVYNQADHIRQVAQDYIGALRNFKHPFEIILVVNPSRDDSWEVCRQFAAEHEAVRAIAIPEAGWGRAVRHGLSVARGQVLAYTNSARTTPHLLVSVLALAFANSDMVIKASRKLRYPFLRRLGSVLYNIQCRALFRLAVWDINGTPKAFSRSIYERLRLVENGDLIDLEFVVQCARQGIEMIEIPVVSATRHSGDSTTGFTSAFRMYAGALRLRRSLGKPPSAAASEDR
jgi:glycosyltransferase involved in cell wall biosynthesis